jgi:hypothetical protein
MGKDADYHIAYLISKLAKLEKNPELNRYQIEAHAKVLQIAKSATSYEDYINKLNEDADLFSLAKSEHIDRYSAMAALYDAFGLSENSLVFKKRLEVASDSKSYLDIATKLPQTLSLPEEKQAIEKLNSSVLFLQLIFQAMTFAEKNMRIAKAMQAKSEMEKIKTYDAGFTIDSFFKNPYLIINPFTKQQLDRLHSAYTELIG